MTEEHMPVVITITAVIDETPTIKTFVFDKLFDFLPGQFCMVWVPGVDEIPMAFSAANTITVMKAGDATAALFNHKAGDKIGIRGPYGNGFLPSGKVLAIAGGVGVTPLFPLATAGEVDTFILGTRTADELVFPEELAKVTDLKIATDDGTRGYHGFVTGIFDQLDVTEYDTVCVCGPEMMMRSIFDRLAAKGIENRGQFSLHRYMKCGVGVCGSCCIDHEGLRVCRDGPVFTGDSLKDNEFAHHHRGPSGRRE
ncbi:MAG: dihydroorotate dehydrogenase electron transfer subunit [Methanocalculaceae archaeon]|nr:dihydroorotate dehydrogenase electron transfer subunit [Methanocalculaceae archaeon]